MTGFQPIQKPYITLKREPFDMETITVVLRSGRLFEVEWEKKDVFTAIHKLKIPELAWDALYNFNEIHFYPEYPGFPEGKIDIQ